MLALILFFILVVIIFGLGFAVEILFWVALALFIIWIIGILLGAMSGGRRRWYW